MHIVRPCFLLTPNSTRPRIPLRELSLKKSPGSQNFSLADAIQDWVSPFSRRSFPAAPRENAPSGSPPQLSGARPVNELLDPSEHTSHSGANLCSQSALLLFYWLFPRSRSYFALQPDSPRKTPPPDRFTVW